MENLLNCKGKRFSAIIDGEFAEGHIEVDGKGIVYLCQDIKDGSWCSRKFGHKYSWFVKDGSEKNLEDINVKNLKLLDEETTLDHSCLDNKAGIESITCGNDYKEGDVLVSETGRDKNVLWAYKDVYIIRDDEDQGLIYLKGELDNLGYSIPKYGHVVSKKEIAEWRGVKAEDLIITD